LLTAGVFNAAVNLAPHVSRRQPNVLARLGQESGHERRGRSLFGQPGGTPKQRLMPLALPDAEPEKVHEILRGAGVCATVAAGAGGCGAPFGIVPVIDQLRGARAGGRDAVTGRVLRGFDDAPHVQPEQIVSVDATLK
jgi:hypothetical protein